MVDLYVPKKMIPHHLKYSPRHYPKCIRSLFSGKAAIWRKLRLDHSSQLLNLKFCRITQQCKTAIYEYDSERKKRLLSTRNLGAFYKFINNKLHTTSDVAPLHNSSGTLLTHDFDKANLLNTHFESVFIKDDGNLPPFLLGFLLPHH